VLCNEPGIAFDEAQPVSGVECQSRWR